MTTITAAGRSRVASTGHSSPRERRPVTRAGYAWLYVLPGRPRLIHGTREILLQAGRPVSGPRRQAARV